MELERHPPYRLTPWPEETDGGAGITAVHATIWARFRVDEWDQRCELHLQLLATEEPDGSWRWRSADLSGHPLSIVPRASLGDRLQAPVPREATAALEAWIERAESSLHRLRSAGLVSEPGESAGAFRRRVLAPLGEAMRRRNTGESERQRMGKLAAFLAREIETIRLRLTEADRLRCSIGWLVIPGVSRLPTRVVRKK